MMMLMLMFVVVMGRGDGPTARLLPWQHSRCHCRLCSQTSAVCFIWRILTHSRRTGLMTVFHAKLAALVPNFHFPIIANQFLLSRQNKNFFCPPWCVWMVKWQIWRQMSVKQAVLSVCLLVSWLNDIALHDKSSQSYETSLAVWDHTVLPATLHKWTRPA